MIYLFQSGGPSQMELFDYKPRLKDLQGTDLPDSIRQGQRLTNMSSAQLSFPMVPSKFSFAQHGQSGAWVSELMPHTAKVADELTFIKSTFTEAINHDPAVTFLQTGADRGTPEHGLVGGLRTGVGEPGPAGVRGDDFAGRGRQRTAALRPPCGARAFCRRATRE